MKRVIVLTCEHGGNKVPAAYRNLFLSHQRDLQSHRGWDPGTRELGIFWQRQLGCQLFIATVTRLLVDLNRSPSHRTVFSKVTRNLHPAIRKQLLVEYHTPHRQRVEQAVGDLVQSGYWVLHIGLHSFTPVLDGQVRNADIGLLYDPRRPSELDFCRRWRTHLNRLPWEPRVRLNYPYQGKSDGLTTNLRKRFSDSQYAGVELEINQKIPIKGGKPWSQLKRQCLQALRQTFDESPR